MARKIVGKPKAGTTLKKVTSKTGKIAKAGTSIGGMLGQGRTSGARTSTGSRRSRQHGTMWYLRQVQRLRAKRKYFKERLKV